MTTADSTGTDRAPRRLGLIVAIAGLAAVAAGATAALLVNVFERKQEGRHPFYRVVDLTDDEDDPAVWGKNFPLQHDGYVRTVDQVRTRHGGSEAMPRTPTDADPRSIVARSRLEEDPRLVTIWAGYPFAVDFREKRGHAFMLEDQTFTQRQLVTTQPGTCLHCHASVYVPYKRLGGGDLMEGFDRMNRKTFAEARPLVEHPVACIDCHDAATMQLRVTRPAFMEGIRAYKASQGVADYDVNRMASRQEMRAFACAQCHVEYYFRRGDNRLVYPWSKGLKADEILAYFDELGFHDWVHAKTGAKVLKAQHPEFELWSQGIHARSGVTCSDCHLPYHRVGALKVSDHHVRSPLLNVSRACQSCHPWSEQELLARAHEIQDRTYELRNVAMDAVVDLIHDLVAAREAGVPDEALEVARTWQRRAQWFVDFIESENSMGFHAPQEAARVLGLGIDAARRGQVAVHEALTAAAVH